MLILLCLLVPAAASARSGTAKVEVLTGFDLAKAPVHLSAGDHMFFLDGKAQSFSRPVTLVFSDAIQVRSGGARFSCAQFEIKPNREKSQATVSMAGQGMRAYPGILCFYKEGDRWIAVNELPREVFVAAVVEAETVARDTKFLQVMAIVVRTRVAQGGPHQGGRFCDRTCCMIYRGAPGKEALEAAEATGGRVLADQNGLIPAYFHACCAGRTLPVEQGIARARPHRCLAGVSDLDSQGQPWCKNAEHYTWTRTLASFEFEQTVKEFMRDRDLGEPAYPITLARETLDHPFVIVGDEEEKTIDAADFRMYLGRKLGWNILLSDRFSIQPRGDQYVFTGHGFGHRVGLCQAGALARLRAGQTIHQVLQAYFPGAELKATR